MKTPLDLERERQRAAHIRMARDAISTTERGSRKFAADLGRYPSPEGMRRYAEKLRLAADVSDRFANEWDEFLAIADAGANDGPIRA
jgi:hypothetical protein